MPTKCVHITVQYCCFSATCSVALPCHVGTCDSSKSAITISPVERILIPRRRLDYKTEDFARVFEGGTCEVSKNRDFCKGL